MPCIMNTMNIIHQYSFADMKIEYISIIELDYTIYAIKIKYCIFYILVTR